MIDNLVSIITPCYNGEKYVTRFLDSILNQTYKKIELIIINDGSNDNTEETILSYRNKFLEQGMEFIYIYQKNKGQAEAINQGLKIFKGEFLTWPDSDDTLHPESIEKKVNFLKNNIEYGFVRTTANIVEEETGTIVNSLKPKNKEIKEELFEDLIFENDVWYAPGCYMVRTKAFIESNPKCKIYASRGGQNWQMLLPIAYKYKCGYIPEELYNYYIRKDSHSHKGEGNYNKRLNIILGYEDILTVVLSEIGVLEQYKEKLNIKYAIKKFKLAFRLNNKEELIKEYKYLRKKGALKFKLKLMYIIREK